MRGRPVAVCLWPGLARLWYCGQWSALLAAVGFAAALNLLLLASFVWPELLSAPLVACGWLLLSVVWLAAGVAAYRGLPRLCDPTLVGDEGLFIRARDEYLQGHWQEAESLLKQLLRHCRHDAEALLLLATLYRRTGRPAAARQRLRKLARLAGGRVWQQEIEQERRQLVRLAERGKGETRTPMPS